MSLIVKDINISKTVTPGTPLVLFSFTVPVASILKVTHFSNYTDTIAAWGDLTWSIKRNGIGIYPYDTLKDQIGLSSDPRLIEPLYIHGGDVLEIIAMSDYTVLCGMGIAFKYEISGN